MIEFFANIFGYLLNLLYELLKNYGLAIILFSVILKIILLPISIKQQKTLKKSAKIQEEMKLIQDKYKGNQEKINQETMDLYKRENMSPFSGCLSAIVQIILLFAMFYLVRSPLTHMKKVEPELIEKYINEIKTELPENEKNMAYPEISVVKEAATKLNETNLEETKKVDYEKLYINMEFLGLDLSNVPTQDMSNPTVFIIPILYVISSFISIRMTSNMNQEKNKENKDTSELDAVANANKTIMWFMPIMSISIALIAPLGLALYWLVNNILMIGERLLLNRFLDAKGEKENAK